MTFKENLLKKINIDKMSNRVLASIGPPDSGRKVDKATMRRLLEMGSYKLRKERDLELYIAPDVSEKKKILVLDNELAIYNTTVEDVVLRKSPYIKEMLNIRNVIKILNDADVIVSKREESVKTIRKECINILDFSFDQTDLNEIANDGIASLEKDYADGVIESLSLFAELLGCGSPPKGFNISHHKIIGFLSKKETGEGMFGPIVIYSIIYNTIKLIEEKLNTSDKENIDYFHNVASGKKKAALEGTDVFQRMKEFCKHVDKDSFRQNLDFLRVHQSLQYVNKARK